jgi:hypothetical protein
VPAAFFDLVINFEKCDFAKPSINFLAYLVSSAGALPLHSNVEAILSHPRPTCVKELQAFLGLVNFYHRFDLAAARLLLPLTDVLRIGKKGGDKFEWSATMEESFQTAKTALYLLQKNLSRPI